MGQSPDQDVHFALIYHKKINEKGEFSTRLVTPTEKIYRNLLQYWLPWDKNLPGQSKSELLTRFHRPGLRPEGNTRRIRGKERRGNDCISGCDQHVPID